MEEATLEKIYKRFKIAASTLSSVHVFLLMSVIIHNSCSKNGCFIFDSFIVAYICYYLTSICINKMRPRLPSQPEPLFKEEVFQMSRCKKKAGSVKLLKDKYDPEKEPHSADILDICIENSYLKISKSEESSLSEMFYLDGAKVSLVPKGLSRQNVWKKQYPICLVLSSSSSWSSFKDSEIPNKEANHDYISLVPYKDGLIEREVFHTLYIFAPTNREKEAYFWTLISNIENAHENVPQCEELFKSSTSNSTRLKLSAADKKKNLIPGEFYQNMEEIYKKFSYFSSRNNSGEIQNYCVEWVNIILDRLFMDFLTQECWTDIIKSKIQEELNKLEMPSFVDHLEVCHVSMGTSLPQFHSVSAPSVNNSGVWLNFYVSYEGSFQMTLKTKLKIMTRDEEQILDDDGVNPKASSLQKNKVVDRIEKMISYKPFQTVAQSKFVKKYIGDISNTPIQLAVELNKFTGTLAINLPEFPTDRIWYGFCEEPIFSLNVNPKVGSHEINLSNIIQIIKQQLLQELKKILVMPNMDDLIIPIMSSPLCEL